MGKYCQKCGDALELVTDQLSNGDEVEMIACINDGLYCVYDLESGSIVDVTDHECDHSLEEHYHERYNGDKLVFDYCPNCGFYSLEHMSFVSEE